MLFRLKTTIFTIIVCVMLVGLAEGKVTKVAPNNGQECGTLAGIEGAVAEEPESLNERERDLRRAKNIRYNSGSADLTKVAPGSELFAEQIWPRVEFLPVSESAVIVIGKVTKIQPFLSEDHSRIYTEITVNP